MNINRIISDVINEFVISNNPSDYAGNNLAPGKEDNDPMYDVSNMFPDMYTDNAYKYYSGYGLDDAAVINQIKYVHNKPNRLIKIYRAVPYINKDIDTNINKLNELIRFYYKYRFFPLKNELTSNLQDYVWNENPKFSYDEMQLGVLNEIRKMIQDLASKKEKSFKINNGDWVTTSKLYAKQHGESNLYNNYKILTKTVKVSQLYTDGNSIFEWGYVA